MARQKNYDAEMSEIMLEEGVGAAAEKSHGVAFALLVFEKTYQITCENVRFCKALQRQSSII